MFPCNQEMVFQLAEAARGSHEKFVPLCKGVRDACIGAPHRKQRFVEFGLIQVLVELIKRHPIHCKEGLVTLASLASTESTLRDVISAEPSPGYLWDLVIEPRSVETAEAAARVLRTILAFEPGYCAKWQCSEEDLLFLLNCESGVISKLGARFLCVLCQNDPRTVGVTLAESPAISQAVLRNINRSDDDALALVTLAWINPRILKRVSVEPTATGADISPLKTLCEFWCLALQLGVNMERWTPPPPLDDMRCRSDGVLVLNWILERGANGHNRLSGTSVASIVSNQLEANTVLKLRPLLEHDAKFLRLEAATALSVFCELSSNRQHYLLPFIDSLIKSLSDKDPSFHLGALIAATKGASVAALTNARAALTGLFKYESSLHVLKNMITDPVNQCFRGALRLIRHFSCSEESVAQVVKLDLHKHIVDSVPRQEDALITLINLTSYGDNQVWQECEYLVRKLSAAALDQNNPLAWHLLANLSATKVLDNKKAFVQSGISISRLVSEKGLVVLRNLCAHGSEHAALLEGIIQPILTFVASGLENDQYIEPSLELLSNLAYCGEAYKTLIFADPRLLNILGRSLDSQDRCIRLAAARCSFNLALTGDGTDEQQQSSPRSPMLRLVQARVMAAASRSPLRFASIHYTSSGAGSLASRQNKFTTSGLLEKLQRISTEDDDDLSQRDRNRDDADVVLV